MTKGILYVTLPSIKQTQDHIINHELSFITQQGLVAIISSMDNYPRDVYPSTCRKNIKIIDKTDVFQLGTKPSCCKDL